tara:strand:- start:7526 stop:7858 length:333 start_codon:yes stop_codon:yes gene_type:complete
MWRWWWWWRWRCDREPEATTVRFDGGENANVGGRGREWRENEEENDDEYEENGENRDVESSAERGAIERYFIERRETRVENHAHVWDASPSAEREEQIRETTGRVNDGIV